MQQEILFNVTPQETRIAILEDGKAQEIFIERAKNRGITGNIYLGHVVRVLPGMQAAFIEIGLHRTAFLHAGDLLPYDDQQADGKRPGQRNDPESNITSRLSEGQRLPVQVIKDPLGDKGARLTTRIGIPGRNLVLLPEQDYISISQKIQPNERRAMLLERLQQVIADCRAGGGYIIRTAGEHATDDELKSEIKTLDKTWQQIQTNLQQAKSPALIHQGIPLAARVVRDLNWHEVEKIRIDCSATYDFICDFVGDLFPEFVDKIEHYQSEHPIFGLHRVEQQMQQALHNKVRLKSGGYLVVDQTEALTVIDVNTGSYVGQKNLAETILKTNLEAAGALARQLRLRNIGGIIIVDFIDMETAEHCEQVMKTLKHAVERDSSRTYVKDMSSLGLVEITRKRTRESLRQTLTEHCPACGGRGIQKTAQTTCYEIFREIMKEERMNSARKFDAAQYEVTASQPVIDLLLAGESAGIADLQNCIQKEIKLKVDTEYQHEQFDVLLTETV